MPPKVVTEREVNATLAASNAGGAGAGASTTAAAGAGSGAGAGSATAGATRRPLPKTASPLPLLARRGGVSLLTGGGLTIRRRLARR